MPRVEYVPLFLADARLASRTITSGVLWVASLSSTIETIIQWQQSVPPERNRHRFLFLAENG
ncbi:MAG: hypothetical protein ACK5IP_06365 [Paracoccus sp. (in: a-proteobacteria)]